MLFLVAHVGIFSYMERMDTVVPAVVAAAVVNAAARYNRNIGAVRNVEIIVNKIRHTGNADDNRDKYFFAFCLAVNQNINARLILFFADFDMFTVTVAERNAVLTEIIRPFLRKSFADLIQNPLGSLIDLCHQQTPPSSPFAHLPHLSCVNRVGRTSSRLPYRFTSPSSITMILSAILRIRS